ncbi:MAG: tyrosine--tRNA ligase [Patescibacteria group bacterium]|nr:tyrosine--tRNA ligase [Patescibacteria group bacterium]
MTIPKKLPEDLLKRGVEEIIQRPSLEEKLNSGRPLRIKHGVDPTTKDLHLGYAVVYEKLRQFQEAGHKIIFLIGGFTGRFGDPTDRVWQRKMRKREEVEALADDYKKQLGKILDISKVEFRSNAEWYDGMSAEELLRIMSKTTVQKMLARDMFVERIKEEREIGLHEIVYPVLQGYDSYMLKADVTVIGRDQKFNELQGRFLQEAFAQKPQDLIIMPLLIGYHGEKKMSQSLGNSINFNDSPIDMYGKITSISDSEIMNYFTLVTRLPMKEVNEIEHELKNGANPLDIKAKLATEIVKIYHTKKEAREAEKYFIRVFRKKKQPDDARKIFYSQEPQLLDVVVCSDEKHLSKSEARRLIKQGAVEIDGKINKDGSVTVQFDAIVKIGKHRFVRVFKSQ